MDIQKMNESNNITINTKKGTYGNKFFIRKKGKRL